MSKKRNRFLTGDRVELSDWVSRATPLSSAEIEPIRSIRIWDDSRWEAFPDAGEYQNTGLTTEVTGGTASAIWLRLKPNEGFDPHQHPNACHTMLLYQGSASIFWESADGKVYRAEMIIGDRPYVITPDEKHAVIAGQQEATILVINTPAEHLHKHDYAKPIRPKPILSHFKPHDI